MSEYDAIDCADQSEQRARLAVKFEIYEPIKAVDFATYTAEYAAEAANASW